MVLVSLMGVLQGCSSDNGREAHREKLYDMVVRVTIDRPGIPAKVTERAMQRTVLSSTGETSVVHDTIIDAPSSEPDGFSDIVASPDNRTTYRHFVPIATSWRKSRPGLDPVNSLSQTTKECDLAALDSFMPLGHLKRVEVPCTLQIAQGNAAAPPRHIVLTITYEGQARRDLGGKSYLVDVIRTVQSGDEPHMDTSEWFSRDLGIALATNIELPTASGALIHWQSKVTGIEGR